MTCKGICIRHKAQKPVGFGRYSTGQKRCQICDMFIKWDGLWCPCCGYRLRTKPRNLKYKSKLRARKKIQEYQLLLRQRHRKLQQQSECVKPSLFLMYGLKKPNRVSMIRYPLKSQIYLKLPTTTVLSTFNFRNDQIEFQHFLRS